MRDHGKGRNISTKKGLVLRDLDVRFDVKGGASMDPLPRRNVSMDPLPRR